MKSLVRALSPKRDDFFRLSHSDGWNARVCGKSVWGYRTPWGALHGAWRLHRRTRGKITVAHWWWRWTRQGGELYRLMYGESPLRALWRRLTACPECHGTGVIMHPGCTCGHQSWSMSPHEAHCGEDPCPRKCPLARDKDTAARIWSWWLQAR